METMRIHSVPPELGLRANKASPVIVATDGRSESDSAVVMGRLFAADPDALRVASVVRPLPVVPESNLVVSHEIAVGQREALRGSVAAQLRRSIDAIEPLEMIDGDPAASIAKLAHESSASLIVCGLGHHRMSDRIFGTETALRLIRTADVPVFAAAERADRAPSRIVIACDFSETSLRAARAAIELASTNATLYLVHVGPRGLKREAEDWSVSYRQDASDALARLCGQLRPAADMVLERVLLEGDPPTELLAFARGVHADLIATGSHGHGFITRMLIGSVATRIVRGSACSVLTVPPAAVMTDAGLAFAR